MLSTTQQRNPPMDRAAYEQLFADYFGAQSVIWLDSGIAGDDTHGHVDDITRFVAPNTVVTMIEQNEQSENYAALHANLGRLKNARTSDGQKLEIVEIPLPRPVVFEGRQLPASYANFYIANGAVLVPVFNDPNDRIALNTLAELFPTREIVPIYSGDLIWGFGALHCMTQQQPAPISNASGGQDRVPFPILSVVTRAKRGSHLRPTADRRFARMTIEERRTPLPLIIYTFTGERRDHCRWV